jgi:hypothetical protein
MASVDLAEHASVLAAVKDKARDSRAGLRPPLTSAALAGQPARYIEGQRKAWQQGKRYST